MLKRGACKRSFNALIGTPLARLRHQGKWLAQVEALRDDFSGRRQVAGGAQCFAGTTDTMLYTH